MTTQDESGTLIMGVGYVTIFSAHLEESISTLYGKLADLDGVPAKKSVMTARERIREIKALVKRRKPIHKEEILEMLADADALLVERNAMIHGLIYSPKYRKENQLCPRTGSAKRLRGEDAMDLYHRIDDMRKKIRSIRKTDL
jgi:hypothetical protein